MKETKIIIKAREFAKKHHAGQFYDKDKDYFTYHIEPVVKKLEGLIKGLDSEISMVYDSDVIYPAMYLHDVIEDTKVTEEDLAKEFSKDVVTAVMALTHSPNQEYYEYIIKISHIIQYSLMKAADLSLNIDTGNENPRKNGYEKQRLQKYKLAFVLLITSIYEKNREL